MVARETGGRDYSGRKQHEAASRKQKNYIGFERKQIRRTFTAVRVRCQEVLSLRVPLRRPENERRKDVTMPRSGKITLSRKAWERLDCGDGAVLGS